MLTITRLVGEGARELDSGASRLRRISVKLELSPGMFSVSIDYPESSWAGYSTRSYWN
jgi:hypothetical protein